ncbi:transglutaminase family protein [Alsobacter sp. SYSU M60028]|uniref:Transglutaminase family protein n=1 Tax=Alsobacter ponti TaxID=2962936 RepID=A0ABT1LHR9_9HYPH|nr:transglutaminase family protein [Alsobacter ponti]MCP8940663.1 transglutaminase family protein [Alsobacter ponti]
MIYDVSHVTTYHYAARVAFARCLLRLAPRAMPWQRVLSHELSLSPAPAETREGDDFFGNRQRAVLIAAPHDTLSIRATSRVEVGERPALRFGGPAWEQVARHALASRDLSGLSPAHFLFASRFAPLLDEAAAYARADFSPGRPVLEAALDLTRRVHADFAYDPAATDVSTPLRLVFAQRAGVCQDFAHAMIAGLRGIGVPCLYVSGYLRTTPPEGQKRLAGADASHAWVAVWCGEEAGWVELDPTNDRPAGPDHVVLAVGRDYADVAPVAGVVLASAPQRLTVAVDVTPVEPLEAGPVAAQQSNDLRTSNQNRKSFTG